MIYKEMFTKKWMFPIYAFLFIAFLKMCGIISMSWWYVTAVIWVPFALLITIFGSFLLCVGLALAFVYSLDVIKRLRKSKKV